MKRLSFLLILVISLFFASTNPIQKKVNITCKSVIKEFNITDYVQTCVPEKFNVTDMNEIANIEPKENAFEAFYIENFDSSYLPLSLYEFLPSLRFFIYENSKLTKINPESLKELRKLVEISFYKNLLTSIDSKTFSNNTMVRKITLTSNRIQKVEFDAFHGLNELREVYLDDNELTKLDERTFRTNPQIQTLNFEINHLEELPLSIFHGLKNLHTLKLDYNDLAELPDRIFLYNNELKVLSVSFNKIERIGETNIEIFKKLEELNILENDCTEGLYREYDEIELENVIKNECSTTCEIKNGWLVKELNETRVKRSTQNFEDLEQKILRTIQNSGIFITEAEFDSKLKTKTFEDTQIENKKEELEKLSKRIESLQESFNELKNHVKTSIDAVNEKSKPSINLDDFVKISYLEELKSKLTDLESNVSKNSDKIGEVESYSKSLKETLDKTQKEFDEKLEKINTNVAEFKEIEQLKADIKELGMSLTKLEANINKKQDSTDQNNDTDKKAELDKTSDNKVEPQQENENQNEKIENLDEYPDKEA